MKNKTILFSIFIFGAVLFSGASNVSADVCVNSLKPKNAPPAPNAAQCEAAESAFDAATIIVTGRSNPESVKKGNYTPIKPFYWANEIAKDPKYSQKFKDGLKFGDAVAFLKERIAKNANDRLMAIDNAFLEVYGRESTPGEQAQWDAQVKAQKAWYAVIVTSEIGKLNADPNKRTEMIKAAYIKTQNFVMPDKVDYWKPRTEHFRLIVNANRNFLYSSDGAAYLIETVKKAFLTKYGKTPTDKELKTALTLVSDKRLIYEQMIQPGISLK